MYFHHVSSVVELALSVSTRSQPEMCAMRARSVIAPTTSRVAYQMSFKRRTSDESRKAAFAVCVSTIGVQNLLKPPHGLDPSNPGWNVQSRHARRPYPVFLKSVYADRLDQIANAFTQEFLVFRASQLRYQARTLFVMDTKGIG